MARKNILKDNSHELHMTHGAEGCSAKYYKIYHHRGNSTVCLSSMHQMQVV